MNKKVIGSFRFLFADRTDIYFSRQLVKLDFQQYLFLKLRKEGYKSVIFIDYRTAEASTVYCVTENTEKQFIENAVIRGTGFFGTGKENLYRTEINDGKKYTWLMKNSDIPTVITNLLANDTESNKRFAFVIDIDTLDALFASEATARFESMLKPLNLKDGSVFVITGPDDYEGFMPHVINYMFNTCKIITSPAEDKTADEICTIIADDPRVKVDFWQTFYDQQLERMAQRIRLDNLLYTNAKSYNKVIEEINHLRKQRETRSDFNRKKLYEETVRRFNYL